MRLRAVVMTGALTLLAAGLLTGCTPPGDDPTVGQPGSHAASPSASATPAETPEVTPEPIPADLQANVIDAMSSGNTAALEGYLAKSVRVTYAAADSHADVTDHTEIINDLTALTSPEITWDFALPASVVSGYANTPPFEDDFPVNSVVGRSSNREVVSFVVAGGEITRVFIALSEDSLLN